MNGFAVASTSRRLSILLAAGVATVALSSAACTPAADTNALAQALTQLDEQWAEVAASKDAERMASFYAEDAITYPPNQPATMGREAAKEVWAGFFADPAASVSWQTAHAGVASSGELGFTAGAYQAAYTGPGGTPVQEAGKYLCVWKKQPDGTWKAIHDMWNTDS